MHRGGVGTLEVWVKCPLLLIETSVFAGALPPDGRARQGRACLMLRLGRSDIPL